MKLPDKDLARILSNLLIVLVLLSLFIFQIISTNTMHRYDKYASSIESELTSLVLETGAIKSLVLASHDSGGIVTVGSPCYTTALYEDLAGRSPSVIEKWERVRADSQYRKLLVKVQSEGGFDFYVREMPEGKLKRTYLELGTEVSFVRFVRKTDYSLFYLSLTFDNPTIDKTEPKILNAIDHRLRRILDFMLEAEREEEKEIERIEKANRRKRSVWNKIGRIFKRQYHT